LGAARHGAAEIENGNWQGSKAVGTKTGIKSYVINPTFQNERFGESEKVNLNKNDEATEYAKPRWSLGGRRWSGVLSKTPLMRAQGEYYDN